MARTIALPALQAVTAAGVRLRIFHAPPKRDSRALTFAASTTLIAMRSPAQILAEAKTIALVGASPKPDRPANAVMRYLLAHGYHVIPVRPRDCDEVHGIPCLASLAEIEERVDLVDVFRRVEACPGVAREAAQIGAKAVWLQLGLVSPEARQVAEEAGMDYVENECTAIVHRRCLSLRS
jgi:uncharacterized protein